MYVHTLRNKFPKKKLTTSTYELDDFSKRQTGASHYRVSFSKLMTAFVKIELVWWSIKLEGVLNSFIDAKTNPHQVFNAANLLVCTDFEKGEEWER